MFVGLQIGDIERHNSLTLPPSVTGTDIARGIVCQQQLQSQVARIISLHQNLLHSLQVSYRTWLPIE